MDHLVPILYGSACVAEWDLYNLHHRGHVSWVGSVLLYADPAQYLLPASEELDGLL